MMYYFDGIIVVEGKSDVAYLSSFIDALYITTNGYEISDEEIDFLKHYSKQKKIIVLTDPDDAGECIRNKLSKLEFAYIDIKVNLAKCDKNGKHGIAECDKNELLNVLKEHLSTKETTKGQLTCSDLYRYGIVDNESRNSLCKKLHLGICNNKQLLKRLNYLNIKLD